MNRFLYLFLLVPNIVQAEIIETWTCTEHYRSDVLAIAYVDKSRESGEIKVAGVTHKSKFSVKGFERRWDFGITNDLSYDYTFVIKPNGDALYYDFSQSKVGEVVKPTIMMKCTRK